MRSARARRIRGRCWLVGLCLALVGGCATTEARLEKALRADTQPGAHAHDLEANYLLRCPDVLDIAIGGASPSSGTHRVGPDGRIQLTRDSRLRVSGNPVSVVAHSIAQRLGLPDSNVRVRVAEYNSQSLYVFCEVSGVQQVVPYRGPETVLDLLQRIGGTAPGACLGDVQIVRSHVADGKPPEVFHVNLSAILLRHDVQTNIRLEPFDRIYIGQSRRSRLACCVPPVLLPLYRRLCGIGE